MTRGLDRYEKIRSGTTVTAVHAFVFPGAEEAFRRNMVEPIANAAHANLYALVLFSPRIRRDQRGRGQDLGGE